MYINDKTMKFIHNLKMKLKKTFFYILFILGFAYLAYESGKENTPTEDMQIETTIDDPTEIPTSSGITENITFKDIEIVKEYKNINDYKEDNTSIETVEIINEYYTSNLKANTEVAIEENILIENKKLAALTFDDGPSKYTNRLIEILDENGAKATFFMIGTNIKKHPEIVTSVIEAGHEIGIHGYTHTSFTKLGVIKTKEEIEKCENLLKDLNIENIKLVRPPYGSINKELKEKLDYSFILWSVDTNDWKVKDKDKVKEEILRSLNEGSIVLMHDIHPYSIDALEELLPELTEYEFVTISELFERMNVPLEEHTTTRKVKTLKKDN